MFLKKLLLSHFRNYSNLSLDLSSRINFFYGENGQGKSSLLEAIYCALKGKSFLSGVQSEFIKKGSEQASIRLFLQEEEGDSCLESQFFWQDNRFKKKQSYCGKKLSPSFLSQKLPCFVFTEHSLKCIRQGPSERRNFVEEFFSSKEDLKNKRAFEQILRQKKQLLKNYKQALISSEDFHKLLSVTNQVFLKRSYDLVQSRLNILEELFASKTSFFKSSDTQLEYSYKIAGEGFFDRADLLLVLEKELLSKQDQEIRAGVLLSGPQKHDIQFLFNGEDSRTFCSKGQQRAYILSLFLGYIKKLPKAFLLLDDVLLELDERTQENFLNFLEKSHCQIFLTNCKITTHFNQTAGVFRVQEGTIIKER